MVALRYELTREDYIAYNEYTSWTAPHMKKRRRLSAFVQLFLFTVLMFLVLPKPNDGLPDPTGWFLMGVALVFGIVYTLFGSRERVRKNTAFYYDLPGNENLFREHQVEFTERGVMDRTEFTDTFLRWAGFTRRVELPDHYLLFQSTIQAFIIPKRAISSEQQAEFEHLLNRCLPLLADLPSGEPV